jgi:hypothetical protein
MYMLMCIVQSMCVLGDGLLQGDHDSLFTQRMGDVYMRGKFL